MQLDHEKLDVYRLQLEFVRWTSVLLNEVAEASPSGTREVRDQLNRASLSVLLNIAEGNGKRQRSIRAKFFDDARGSATECAACLDVLVVMGVCAGERVAEGKGVLVRVVSMLTKLVARYNGSGSAREEEGGYDAGDPRGDEGTADDDDEDDDEDECSAVHADTRERE
jgi:four helix bundle protein